MCEQITLKKHAALFDEMGQTVGLDLQQQAIDGKLRFDEISEAVLRCTRCAHPERCASWMQAAHAETGQAPDYCRNRDLLEYLQDQPA